MSEVVPRRLRWMIAAEAAAIFSTGLFFAFFGWKVCNVGAWPFGAPFGILGLFAMMFAIVHLVRGDRLGVRLEVDSIVVYLHFGREVVPLSSVKKFYRSVDATVLVLDLDKGQKVIDDGIFHNVKARNDVLAQLKTSFPNSKATTSTTGH